MVRPASVIQELYSTYDISCYAFTMFMFVTVEQMFRKTAGIIIKTLDNIRYNSYHRRLRNTGFKVLVNSMYRTNGEVQRVLYKKKKEDTYTSIKKKIRCYICSAFTCSPGGTTTESSKDLTAEFLSGMLSNL